MENMKIKITNENADKINAVINKVEKGCRTRKINYYIIDVATKIFTKSVNIPLSRLKGTIITVDVNAEYFPHSYRGIPESTFFKAIFTGKYWYLIDVYRHRVNSPEKHITAKYTDETLEYIKDRAVKEHTFISK